MPLMVNNDRNVWAIKQISGSENREVKTLIVDGIEVWNEPQEMSERVTVTTSNTGIKDTDGLTWYNGSASINIGVYRKKVTVSGISLGSKPTISYDEKTGIATVSVKSVKANTKVLCNINYFT